MFAHCRLIWGNIHAIDLVVGHITFEPLDLWSELLEDIARLLRDTLQLFRRELPGYVLWVVNCNFFFARALALVISRR